MTAPPDYGIQANPDLLTRIPLDARAVLDIGCGAGGLGAAWRRRNPATRLIAVEPNPELAAIAEAHYDEVHRLDIETEAPPVAPGSLDAITLGDVLEHLRDPWAVLKRDAQLLAEDGVLVACVPNVEHWSFVARLLKGTWRYEQMGLYRTHLRWFTRDGMKEMLEGAGLVPVDVASRIFGREEMEQFLSSISPALQALGVQPQDYARRAAPLQYVWRATPRRVRPFVVAALALKQVGGINDVRIHQPLAALSSYPGVMVQVAQGGKLPPTAPETPRVLILQRLMMHVPQAPAYLRSLRMTGAVIVQEFDDDPANWPEIERSGHLAFRGVHAVQTSTRTLAALLREWNPELAIFPNTVMELPEPRNFANPGRLSLFLGSINREADVAPFIPALNTVLAEAGERMPVQVVHDKGLFQALETPHKRFAPLLDYASYRALMAECEIAFLPLRDTRFNRMKSDLKWVEAAAHRLCSLASPVVYGETIRDGDTGSIVRSPEDVSIKLRALLAEPTMALRMAEAARAEVGVTRLLSGQVRQRMDWYQSLWERRAELDAALLERAPECG